MKLLVHNAIALTVGVLAGGALSEAGFQAAFLGLIIGTAGTRLALGMATDPRFRRR